MNKEESINSIIKAISEEYKTNGNRYSRIYVAGLHELIGLLDYEVGVKLHKSKYE